MARGSAQQECPHFGATFPSGRPACPECGSDANTGWKEADEIDYQAVDLPEAADEPTRARHGPALWILILAVVAFTIVAIGWR
jgi:hypothetical protein